MIRREEARWKERVAGRKGGREKEARVRCEEGTGRGKVAAGGKRGSRHETATERRELAFTKHQNGTYRGPVISPYSFRIRIGKGRVRKRERSQIFSRVEPRARTHIHTNTNRSRVSHAKVDDGAENVSVINTCFSRGASRTENSLSGKRVLFVAIGKGKRDRRAICWARFT